jgi:hypothetical protein
MRVKCALTLGLCLGLATASIPAPAFAKPQSAPGRREEPSKENTRGDGSARHRRAGRAHGPGAQARARKEAQQPCLKPKVELTRERGDETERRIVSLTFCDGQVNPDALDSLSVLARPRSVERPLPPQIRAYRRRPTDRGPKRLRRDPGYLSSDVRLLHPGLIERLQRVAEHFPDRTFEIVSGHRPDARVTSRHHHARALDFRVQGVSRERLRDFLRTFPKTGVGYYPNSTFVHMDVRDDKGYWVDRSGPGEPADYGSWPPTPRELDRATARILADARSGLAGLSGTDLTGRAPAREARAQPARSEAGTPKEVVREHDETGDALSEEEIARIRREARRALASLRE